MTAACLPRVKRRGCCACPSCALTPAAELGIDLSAILSRTAAVLGARFQSRQLEELDMGGALLFVFVLAGLQLLVRLAGARCARAALRTTPSSTPTDG
jgi:hypothetical protein